MLAEIVRLTRERDEARALLADLQAAVATFVPSDDYVGAVQYLASQRDEARALLRQVEWGGRPYAPKSHCPSCHALYLDGAPDDHDDACALKAALTEGRLP